MTRADRHHHFDLMPTIHLGRKFAGGSANRQEICGGDNNLALGDDYAADRSTVQDAGYAASQIATNYYVYDVSRQADNVRAGRFSVVHSHSEISPEPHSRDTFCALSEIERNKNQRQGASNFYQTSFLFRSGTGMHANVRSSVKFPRRGVASFNSNSVAASRDGTPAAQSLPRAPGAAGNNSVRAS